MISPNQRLKFIIMIQKLNKINLKELLWMALLLNNTNKMKEKPVRERNQDIAIHDSEIGKTTEEIDANV